MPTLPMRTLRRPVAWMVLALVATSSNATGADVVSIEEHWQLEVGGPEIGRSAPQVSLVMSPTSDLLSDFFLVTINHWNAPQFSAGGIQLQHWCGDDCVSASTGLNKPPLSIDAEIITWTQRIRLNDGLLTFEIVNGRSESWGEFGGDGALRLATPSSLTRLNNYKPAVSLGDSGIGYAGNRVSSLTLKKLVWTTAAGDTQHLIAPIDIATHLDGHEE